LTNNGPDTVSNVSVNQACSVEQTIPLGTKNFFATAGSITITLSPGQTGEFNTGFRHR
jgi:hypothetical protein